VAIDSGVIERSMAEYMVWTKGRDVILATLGETVVPLCAELGLFGQRHHEDKRVALIVSWPNIRSESN
jgi:hypothetical protein